LLEVFGAEIAGAVIELEPGALGSGQAQRHFAEASVEGGVRAVVAQNVIAAYILPRLLDAERQFVFVEQRFAASVHGQGGESLLLVVEAVPAFAGRIAGEGAGTARGALSCVAAWRQRHQPARVDGIKRDVSPYRSIDRGAELRFVLRPRLSDSAREIDQRLAFGEAAEHLGRRFERAQFAVCVEDVEFGLIRRERGLRVFSGVGIGGVGLTGERAALADAQSFDYL